MQLSRRQMMGGAAVLAGTAAVPALAQAKPKIVTYHDPGCGCCHKWADQARRAGFTVEVRDAPDIMAVKTRLGVPADLVSCHTSVVGGYVVEGHVPLAAVLKLVRTRPRNVTGIAVPGMPRGSPGMEMPDGSKDPFDVIAFNRKGVTAKFA
jgi:hypothetical protein